MKEEKQKGYIVTVSNRYDRKNFELQSSEIIKVEEIEDIGEFYEPLAAAFYETIKKELRPD